MELKFRLRDSDPWEEYEGAAIVFVFIGIVGLGFATALLIR